LGDSLVGEIYDEKQVPEKDRQAMFTQAQRYIKGHASKEIDPLTDKEWQELLSTLNWEMHIHSAETVKTAQWPVIELGKALVEIRWGIPYVDMGKELADKVSSICFQQTIGCPRT
jgi:hypothetical protein